MTARQVAALCIAVVGCTAGSPEEPGASPIVLDGRFVDWDGVVPLVDEGFGDTPSGAPADLGEILAAHDGRSVTLSVRVDRLLNLQSFAGTLRFALDVDGDARTGRSLDGMDGVDVVIDFSLPAAPGGVQQGVGVRVTTADTVLLPDAFGVEYAPTHAAERFELRFPRGIRTGEGVRAFLGAVWRGRLMVLDSAEATVDDSPVFEAGLEIPFAPNPRLFGAEAVARSPAADLRVVGWNIGDHTMLRSAEPFARILAALTPDVVLLDEVGPRVSTASLEAIARSLAGEGWRVIRGEAGGRQNAAILSRLPLEPVEALRHIAYPDSLAILRDLPLIPQLRRDLESFDTDGIPAVGAAVRVADRRVLVVALDLFCCGRIGSPDDRGRIMAAGAIRDALLSATGTGAVDGIIVAGDLNLVGSREPLDRLLRGLDPAGGDLRAAEATRLDGGSVHTWRAPAPFPPGRLDWLLYSPSTLDEVKAFTFDTAMLTPQALASLGLDAADSDVVDHLPVVADLRVRRPD